MWRYVLKTLRKWVYLIFLLPVLCPAAFEIQSLNTAGIALGSVSSLYPGLLNPAVLTPERSFRFHTDYSQLYGIKGLDYYHAGIDYGFIKRKSAGLVFQNLGNSVYQEKTVTFKFGQDIRNVLSLGLSLNVYNVAISGYQSSTAFGLNVGSVLNLDKQTQLAFLYQNVNNPSICEQTDPLPQCFYFGVRYFPKSSFELYGELFKDTEFPFSLRLASVLKPFSFMDIKCGVQFKPDRFSGGVSVYWRKLSLDIAVLHHQVLPYTFFYGLGYGFR